MSKDWVDVMAMLVGSRFVESKHLGLGDIRLTTDEQDRIVDYVHRLEARIAELEKSHFNAVQYQNDLLKIIETQGQLLNGRTEASIKAEGIQELEARIAELEAELEKGDD